MSEQDNVLFEEAKTIAGEALSSVIARALREFISRHKAKEQGMKEITVKVGSNSSKREQRFLGTKIGTWKGFSDDKEWWLQGDIYKTQKGNWAIHLTTICKASLLLDKKKWKESGDYLLNVDNASLIIGKTPEELKKSIPAELFNEVVLAAQKDEQAIEYLDI